MTDEKGRMDGNGEIADCSSSPADLTLDEMQELVEGRWPTLAEFQRDFSSGPLPDSPSEIPPEMAANMAELRSLMDATINRINRDLADPPKAVRDEINAFITEGARFLLAAYAARLGLDGVDMAYCDLDVDAAYAWDQDDPLLWTPDECAVSIRDGMTARYGEMGGGLWGWMIEGWPEATPDDLERAMRTVVTIPTLEVC